MGGAPGSHPPLTAEMFSISSNFLENLAKLYVGAHPTSQKVWAPFYGKSGIRPCLITYSTFQCETPEFLIELAILEYSIHSWIDPNPSRWNVNAVTLVDGATI